ncbi:MAG: putative glycosyl transferase [Bacteroidetes bacterium]|jgi:glycosyltransferase involved in cell wall biosynthesis|nr:putative glycosyl transferase [Bacteroidota bacterium]
MSTDLVSICIPSYNGAPFLERCIRSCLSQTYPEIEIIINDDCSTDDTFALAEKWMQEDKRIKVHRNTSNLGLVGNWNETLSKTKGEWIKMLFQDDWMEPQCIEEMMKAGAALPESLIVSSRSYSFADGVSEETKAYYNNGVRTLKAGVTPVYFSPGEISKAFVANIGLNFIGEPSLVFFQKRILLKAGLFDKDFLQLCDLEHALRIATSSGLVLIPAPLVHFSVHTNSTTSKNISVNTFRIRYFEVPHLIYKIRQAEIFKEMLQYLSVVDKCKLFLYSKLRAIEARQAAGTNGGSIKAYDELVEKFPHMRISTWDRVFLFPLFIFVKYRFSKQKVSKG